MRRANDTLLKGHKMHDEHYFKYWLIILSTKRLRMIGGVHLRFKRCMIYIVSLFTKYACLVFIKIIVYVYVI